MLLGGVSLHALGFQTPALPTGMDAGTFTAWFLLGSMLLAFGLSFLSFSLRCNWFARWIILEELIWVACVVGMVLESYFFLKMGLVSSFFNGLHMALEFLLPGLFFTATIAILFRPGLSAEARLRPFFAAHEMRERLENQ
jgi:hypothetical protein